MEHILPVYRKIVPGTSYRTRLALHLLYSIPASGSACLFCHTQAGRPNLLSRGTIVNRTCSIHKKELYIQSFLPTIFGPINYRPP